MHIDEQHEPSESSANSPEGSGLWAHLADYLSAAAARVQAALGADSLSDPPARQGLGRNGRDRRGVEHTADAPFDDTAGAGAEPGKLQLSRADGHLRISEGPEAYIESDTWEAVDR